MQNALQAFVLLSCSTLSAVGLTAMVLGVRCRHQRRQRVCQRLYTVCLVCIGACTLLAVGRQDAIWICGAVAYAGLAVGATVEWTAPESW